MNIAEQIQYDLDAGRFNAICSNEDTFKSYVFNKLVEAEKEERKENIDTAFKVATAVMEVKYEKMIKELRELRVITPDKEPPKNKLTQNQIFEAGQMNVLIRIAVILDKYN